MQPLNFDVPIDIDQFGLTSEQLIGTREREVIRRFWDKKRQAVLDLGIDFFQPFTREHQKFLLSTEHEGALLGGNSSAKSWTAAAKFTAIMIGRHPTIKHRTPCAGWVACEDFSLTKDGPLKALLTLGTQYIAEFNQHDKIIKYKNGSEAQLKSFESGWKKFQSAAIDVVWLDEEPPEDIYKECQMRTMRTSGYIFTSMTPLEGMTYMYDQIFGDGNEKKYIDAYIISLFDNFTLKEEDIERTIRNYSSQEKEARIYGKFTQMAGLVYPEFRKGKHTIPRFKLSDDYVVFTGIDPHTTTPTAVVFLAVGKLGDEYVIGEMFLEGSIEEMSAEIKKGWLGLRTGWSVMDSSAQTEIKIFGKDIYSGFCLNGINALLAPKGPGSIGKGISDIRERLKPTKLTGKPKLRIFDDCTMTIKSAQTLTREKYRDESRQGQKDKVAEGRHHHHAALRYIYQVGPYYFEPMTAPDELPPMDDAVGY